MARKRKPEPVEEVPSDEPGTSTVRMSNDIVDILRHIRLLERGPGGRLPTIGEIAEELITSSQNLQERYEAALRRQAEKKRGS